jgi:hypothetical protein
MSMIILVLFLALNFGISWLNAWACGKAWAEAKSAGGWPRFMTWMGAIMSASGFTWVFVTLASLLLGALEILPPEYVMYTMELGYIVIIPGILFSGLMIMIDSWARAYREGGVLNYGVAAWNTYAQVHNTYHAIDGMGKAFSDIGEGLFGGGSSRRSSSSSDKNAGQAILVLIVIAVVVLAAIGGTLLTMTIIKRTAGNTRLLSEDEMRRKQAQKVPQ